MEVWMRSPFFHKWSSSNKIIILSKVCVKYRLWVNTQCGRDEYFFFLLFNCLIWYSWRCITRSLWGLQLIFPAPSLHFHLCFGVVRRDLFFPRALPSCCSRFNFCFSSGFSRVGLVPSTFVICFQLFVCFLCICLLFAWPSPPPKQNNKKRDNI